MNSNFTDMDTWHAPLGDNPAHRVIDGQEKAASANIKLDVTNLLVGVS